MHGVGMEGSAWRLDCWACIYLVTTLFNQRLDCLVGHNLRTQQGYGMDKNEFLY